MPTACTEAQAAEFLVHLKQDKKLSLSTMKGYLTVISQVVSLYTGENLSSSPALISLMQGLTKSDVKASKSVPGWSLEIVLKTLQKTPFEPMTSCDLDLLTYKTVFLITLAAGGRRGEIHALTVETLTHGPEWEWVEIWPDVTFLAKNQKLQDGPRAIRKIVLKALEVPKDSESSEMTLCPVRALKIYLQRVEATRKGRKPLFIPISKGCEGDVHIHTFSGWLKKCITKAYQHSENNQQLVPSAKAHDVRKLAVSWAFHQNASVDSIVRACKWKSANSFITYYLKDCSGIRQGMSVIGPIIVAGHVV